MRILLGFLSLMLCATFCQAQQSDNEKAQTYVWKKYGQDTQKRLEDIGRSWLTPNGLTDAERLEIAHGIDSARGALGVKLANAHVCADGAKAIPEAEQNKNIGGSPVYYRFRVACTDAERKIIDDARLVIADRVRETVASDKQRAEKQANEEAQKRLAAAPEEAATFLKQFPVHWVLSDKVDEMSGNRVIAARSDQKGEGSAPNVVRVEIQCQATNGRKALVTQITSFTEAGAKLVGTPLPRNAQVRYGNEAPKTISVQQREYRNVGLLSFDWSRWAEYAIVRAQLELDGSPVLLRIVPFDGVVRRVLDGCSS
jgi:hypothetical protein